MVDLDRIYNLLLETRDDVRDVKNKIGELADDSTDHESRIRALERLVWRAAGVALVGGAGVSQLLSALLGGT